MTRAGPGQEESEDAASHCGGQRVDLPDPLIIRPITIDEFSTVRYIHVTAFRREAVAYYRDDEIEAFCRHVSDPNTARNWLADNLHGAFLGQTLVGTAGWVGSADNRGIARIKHVFVRSFFTGLGFGHRLIAEMECLAAQAGYSDFSVRATLNAVGFFETSGYEVSSHGVRPLAPTKSLAVTFMRKSTRIRDRG